MNSSHHKHHGWQTSLISGFFCFVLILGVAIFQATDFPIATLNPHNWLRILATGFLLGFLPATLLGHASGWLRQQDIAPAVASAVFWLPTALAWVISGALFMRDDSVALGPELIVLFGAGVGLSVILWRFRGASSLAPFWLAPTGLAWMALTFFLMNSVTSAQKHPTLAHQALLLASFLAPPLLLALAKWEAFWARRQASPSPGRARALLPAAGLLGGLGTIVWVHTLFMGIYLPLKAWLSISVVLGIWRLYAPFYGRWAHASTRLIGGVVALGVLPGAATFWLLLAPIPQRFGGFPARSMVGLAVRSVSFIHDADADGFYAESVGGNDCDDSDPEVHPAAINAAKNCWARAEQIPPAPVRPARSQPPKTPGAFGSEHIIVYISDATRADAIYGPQAGARFPNLSKFARETVRFERAYAPGNSTVQSVLPMLSGISPIHAHTSMERAEPLPRAEMIAARSIFELAPERFCNVMITYSHKAEEWLVANASERLEIARSETDLDRFGHTTPGAVDAFQQALDHCEGRRLMAVLYSDDPHRDDRRGGYSCADGSVGGRTCYLEAIGVVDREFGRLRATLEERGILQNALFIMTSDHGEAFGEHGYTTHSSSVFDEQVHVPLLVHLPDTPPVQIATPVSLLGLKATIAEAAGLELKHAPIYPSWLNLVADPRAGYPAPISQNWHGAYNRLWAAPSSAFVAGDDKLIYDWKTGFVRVYNLADDPGETHNLAATHPEKTAALLGRFKAEHTAQLIHYDWSAP